MSVDEILQELTKRTQCTVKIHYNHREGSTFAIRVSLHQYSPTKKKVMNYKLVTEATGDTLDAAVQELYLKTRHLRV